MSSESYPHLFSDAALGSVQLRNRACVAPMTRISAGGDGVPTDIMVDHYQAFAKGGWGLIFTEGTYVDEAHSQGYRDQPGQANDAHAAGWKRVVDAVHAENTPIFQQLIHAGGLIQENSYVEAGIAPSKVDQLGNKMPHYYGEGPFPEPREITKDEMKEVATSFASAAQRAVEVGFDGVEIHGANGYLLDQFLTTFANVRDDEYGGSTENRIRFHCEVLAAILEVVGSQVPVGIRISQTKVNNFDYQWPGEAEDAKIIFNALKAVGPTYIHISTHKGLEEVWNSGRNLADWAKEIWGGPTIACGGLNDPARADKLLADGQADFCALGKGALADPAWPQKIQAGEGPISFNPGMILPFATLQNTLDWRADNAYPA